MAYFRFFTVPSSVHDAGYTSCVNRSIIYVARVASICVFRVFTWRLPQPYVSNDEKTATNGSTQHEARDGIRRGTIGRRGVRLSILHFSSIFSHGRTGSRTIQKTQSFVLEMHTSSTKLLSTCRFLPRLHNVQVLSSARGGEVFYGSARRPHANYANLNL